LAPPVSAPRTGSLEYLRELNRLRVIDTLRRRGIASRAQIARETGLSRSTVSSIVAGLQETGVVVQRDDPAAAERGSAPGGRPPVMLALDPSAGAVLGIDFGHSHLRVGLADLSHAVVAERARALDVDHSAQEGMDAAAELVEEVLDEAGMSRARLLGVGMGVPGPIDQQTGLVGSSSILPGWVGVNAEQEMRSRLGLPVELDNDANLGALGELTYGAGRGADDVIYLKVSSGIGAGLIIGGRLQRGVAGTAGEIGHVFVSEHGPICRCGNRGCLETLAAGPALLQLMRESRGEDLTLRELVDLARAGDLGCRRAIADAGRAIGRVVAGLCNVLNPQMVIVGGDLSRAENVLLDPLREELERFALPTAIASVRVVPGVLADRAEMLGALALVGSEGEQELVTASLMSSTRGGT
jgi:predicted NBD/HSP70 family sugar kinase